MKTWIFAGITDKRELLIYLSKILCSSGVRVLLVDGTGDARYKYSIHSGSSSKIPITEYSGFDVATNFQSEQELYSYYRMNSQADPFLYDYILYDVECTDFLSVQTWQKADQRVWVTSHERYPLEHGKQFFSLLLDRYPELGGMVAKRIYMHCVDNRMNDEYVKAFATSLPISWDEEAVSFLWEEGNIAIRREEDYEGNVGLHRISRSYKRALRNLVGQLTDWNEGSAKKAIRIAGRR
ncbi:hypothetical protein J2Z69_000816 [Paenibacillus shirakamiensis]|uniref:Uncharacterized protein n=1 Tax=Paenibacillus shirakamiensis TaxID=1265935 RepID=A0ABS4JDJ3_9BACL|nr:hypothetical protein [Paenibacillus shirakamiensis]MBP1999797.1 hypothetical protein [Paenibacillus shirakamiensis]